MKWQLIWNEDTETVTIKGPLFIKIKLCKENSRSIIKSAVKILRDHLIDNPLCNRIMSEELSKSSPK